MIKYELQYSKIKNIYIQIKNGKVMVKAPRRTTKKELDKIVTEKEKWIEKTLEKEKSNNKKKQYIQTKNLKN